MHALFLVAIPIPLCTAIIGHIHMAKTGGTVLNEILANTYHGVCGHKGYSFDFYQANKRLTKQNVSTPGKSKDSINILHPGFDRVRVPPSVMEERGFEACDWISNEIHMGWWKRFESWPDQLELHVPCRDPVEHFMSQANHKGIHFDCSNFDTAKSVQHAIIDIQNRFNFKDNPPSAKLRCIHFFTQFSAYPSKLGLRKKSITAHLHRLSTNKERNRTNECIWSNFDIQLAIRDYMLTNYDYYKFCNTCTDWVV